MSTAKKKAGRPSIGGRQRREPIIFHPEPVELAAWIRETAAADRRTITAFLSILCENEKKRREAENGGGK